MNTNKLTKSQVAEVKANDSLFMQHWYETNCVLESLGSPEALYGDFRRAYKVHGIRDSHEAAHYVMQMRGEE